MIPRATYRLQFSPGFGFRDAARIAPYLAELGVSHVYASPFFAARPGSTHGYDTVDHNRLNPELGSEADFVAMSDAFKAHGLGMIADFVPNHMGIGGATNRFWLDVLERGRDSAYAVWFDIDWNAADPALTGKVLMPFLGASYGDVLADGGLELRLDADAGSLAVWAHDTHKLPVRFDDYAGILRGAGLPDLAAAFEEGRDDARAALAERLRDDPAAAAALTAALAAYSGRRGDLASWTALDGLIARQHWRASKFDLDRDAINFRRFFVISDLAGLRIEDPAVFDATHGLVLELLRDGRIDGVRIDHIDGLRDPKAYARRLRASAGQPFYLLVEKILAPDERLRWDWGADGTTGYEFANLLVGLLVDPAATDALSALYRDFTGASGDPEAVVRAAKVEMMTGAMAAEVGALADRLHTLAQGDLRTRDLGRHSLRTALVHVIAGFDVYRTYIDDDGPQAEDRARVAAAVARGRAQAPGLDPQLFDFIAAALTLDLPHGGAALSEFALRVQQVTGPIMAKGLEDTALYRFNRLIALNEVGSEPGRYAIGVDAFHAANAERLAREPHAMLATSTHDTKRGEDARARIAAVTSAPQSWAENVRDWRRLLGAAEARIAPNEEYFLYQLLLGAWPTEPPAATPAPEALGALRDRVTAALLKSVREAGVHTRWVNGDPEHEARLEEFVRDALDPERGAAFIRSFHAAAVGFAAYGGPAGLVQAALKLTVPGVPDIYQGAELWDQSLVDPDNRRPVDFDRRAAILAGSGVAGAAADVATSETTKLALTARLLEARRRYPDLFAAGSYEPLATEGAGGRRVCAFVRRSERGGLFVAAALGWRHADRDAWAGHDGLVAAAGASGWTDLFEGLVTGDEPDHLFGRLPVAALLRPDA